MSALDKKRREVLEEILRKQCQITRRIDVVEHAKLVRAELKKQFPDIRLRVESSRFPGGTAVTVRPVDKLSRKRQEGISDFIGRFNGFASGWCDDTRYNVGFLYKGERVQGALFCQYNFGPLV